jgi:hypothetical protein
MSIKRDELANPRSCLNKARPDEPLFVLRANDPTAAQVVRLWVAMNDGRQPPDKCGEALECADRMEKWHGQQPKAETVAGLATRNETRAILDGASKDSAYLGSRPGY